MFEICLKFCCQIQFWFTTHQCPNIFLNQTISEKTKNRFEDMELTVDRSYRIWNSWSKLEKEWNLLGWSTEKPYIVYGLYSLVWGFSRGVTHFYRSSLAMTFEFSGISKRNITLGEYLKGHFINHHACFFSVAEYW